MGRGLSALTCALFISVGCTRGLRPSVEAPLTAGAPLSFRAALVVDQALLSRTDTYGSFHTLGGSNTWVCQTGVGLVPALEVMLRATFVEVEVVAAASQVKGADVVVVAQVVELRHIPERDGFWIAFKLHAVASDASGPRLDQSYAVIEEGSTLRAVMGAGTGMGADAALLRPTERAMARALLDLARDLRTTFEQPPPTAVPPI